MVLRLDELLSRRARSEPDRVALVDSNGRICRYGELLQMAVRVAVHLGTLGVGPGDRVGICVPKNTEAVASIFGVLMAGAAYVPVDPANEALRSAMIYSGCEVKAILVDVALCTELGTALQDQGNGVRLDGEALYGIATLVMRKTMAVGNRADAYILHTSGSTGTPKGVVHTHASALAFVRWSADALVPDASDNFASYAPLHFDLSIFDIFLAIYVGASIRLISVDESRQPRQIAKIIADNRITVLYATPTTFKTLLEFGELAKYDHSSLRIVCFAGEIFQTHHLRALSRVWTGPSYFNLYGPTETNVCTYYHVENPQDLADGDSIPIGSPCSGNELRVVDKNLCSVLVGEEGELLVRGESVMRGYWGTTEQHDTAFVDLDNGRWYRTGDFVVQLPSSLLSFKGRRDRMVKRRGYRIELDEVEALILRHGAIQDLGVVSLVMSSGDTFICAFFCCSDNATPSGVELKKFCSTKMPLSMVPDRFIRLPVIPTTSTGKTDYSNLKDLLRGFLPH